MGRRLRPAGSQGALLSNPVHYRDSSSEDGFARLSDYVPRREIFERTGIQFMPTNGINRMVSLIASGSALFEAADTMLTIADLFNYWLSGSKTCEFTMATTWQALQSTHRHMGRRAGEGVRHP
ncbi:MAG: hypothetical protein HND48_18720 [Chloroflexi bacterium]|nr:hypothetical protein [Chloroflexota bacterium]